MPPLGTVAQIGLATAPVALKGLSELINPSRPSAYENKLGKLAETFGAQATAPVTQNSAFVEGQAVLNNRDAQNRERAENTVGAGNNTQDAKLAVMQGANASYAEALARLFGNASRFRDFNRNKQISVLGMQEQAKQLRLGQDQNQLASIVRPASQAVNALLLSDVKANKKTGK